MARVITLLTFLFICSTSFGQYYYTDIYVHGQVKNTSTPLTVKLIYTNSTYLDSVINIWSTTSDSSGNFSGTIDSVQDYYYQMMGKYIFIVENCYSGIDSFRYRPSKNDTIVPELNHCGPLSDECEAKFSSWLSKGNLTTPNFFSNSVGNINIRETYDMGDGKVLVDPGTRTKGWDYYRNFTHTYPQLPRDTSYEVCMYLYDSTNHCRDTLCKKVEVGNSCNMIATIRAGHKDLAYTPLEISVWTSPANKPEYKYEWYFNDTLKTFNTDSTNSKITSPIGKTIHLKLILTDTVKKCTTSDERNVVPGPCLTDFSHTVTTDPSTGNLVIHLTNKSANKDDFSFKWDIWYNGPFSSSSTTDYSAILPGEGTYTVSLTKNGTGCQTLNKSIEIKKTPLCAASFSSTMSADTVFVKNLSTNSRQTSDSVSFKWNFGDNTIVYSSDSTLFHIYKSAGNFKILLTMYDSATKCSSSFDEWVTAKEKCNASFTAFVDSRWKTDTVHLLNNSTTASGSLDHVSFRWDFGDSSSLVSSEKILRHGYKDTGDYKVVLYMYDSTTQCSSTAYWWVQIVSIPPSCVADFEAVIATDTVYIMNTSYTRKYGLDGVSFKWNFGDTSILNTTSQVVSHGFADTGYYKLVLTMYDSITKCSLSKDQWIHIDSLKQTGCTADFSHNIIGNQLGLTSLEDSADNEFNVWEAYKGGGFYRPYSYPFLNGRYKMYKWNSEVLVCNTVEKLNFPCRTKECRIIQMPVKSCNAKFSVVKDTSVQFGIKVVDQSTVSKFQDYRWYFGDGDSSTSRTPTHDYDTFGRYNLCLKIFGYWDTTNLVYCEDIFCKEIGMDSTGKLLKKGAFSITVVDGTVSVITPERDLAQLYPNPNNGIFYIDNISGNMPVIRVFDIRGVEVPITVLKEQSGVKIQLEDPTTGVYLLEVVSDGLRSTARVIVQ